MTEAQQQAVAAMRAAFGHGPDVTYTPLAESFVGQIHYHVRAECRRPADGGLPFIVFTRLDAPS